MSLEEWADLHGEDYPKGKFFSALDYGRGDRTCMTIYCDYSGHNREDGWAALVLDITLRHLTPRALDGLYCPHCGELLSEHLITERGGYCQTARQ